MSRPYESEPWHFGFNYGKINEQSFSVGSQHRPKAEPWRLKALEFAREPFMRTAAVIANLTQMVIILLVFLLQGFVLGNWTVLALFILLLISFLNLLVLLFHSALAGSDQTKLFEEPASIIKRQGLRVTYAAGKSPILVIGTSKFKVLDLSETGVRFAVGRSEQLKKRPRCQLTLLSGPSLTFKAVLIRRVGGEAVLKFKQPIAYQRLIEEKQAATR
jgi:hypothetical protein